MRYILVDSQGNVLKHRAGETFSKAEAEAEVRGEWALGVEAYIAPEHGPSPLGGNTENFS